MMKWLLRDGDGRELRRAKVIKAIDHGARVQLLCEDDGGLLSVYLDQGPFEAFERVLGKAGMELKGALIGFDEEVVQLAFCGKRLNRKAR